jgi:hypothetical protein
MSTEVYSKRMAVAVYYASFLIYQTYCGGIYKLTR